MKTIKDKYNKALAKEFEADWKHFCDCIDFARSYLDADAIRFMNEVPGKIIEALRY